MDLQTQVSILGLITVGLATIAWYMIREWKSGWETRLTAQDERLDRHAEKHGKHDVNHARLTSDLDHIKATTEEIGKDVKTLLIQSNGNRSSG